jgi:hypothetical protein
MIRKISVTFQDGSIFTGVDWTDAGPEGKGELLCVNGDKYIGEFHWGKKSGTGTYSWKNGRRYTGQWHDDKENGEGTMYVPGSHTYVGEWKDGQMQGQGTWTNFHNQHHIRSGLWKNGKQNGYGMIKNGEGVFTYAGQVVNDSIEGTGCMIYPSGAVYQGQWKKGLQHCIGRFLYSDGVTEQ